MAQLNQEQRYKIFAYQSLGMTLTSIAEQVGVHKSTISRELRRNRSPDGNYLPEKAEEMIKQRRIRAATGRLRITPKMWRKIYNMLRKGCSPDVIAGRLRNLNVNIVSFTTIYRHIWRDRLSGGELYKLLLRKGRKPRKKSSNGVGKIIDRTPISQRPPEVDARQRIGDFEIDTMIGGNHNGALVTVLERVTRMVFIYKVIAKDAVSVKNALIAIFKRFKPKILTITSDNGTEFALHKQVAEAIGAKFYFAEPYSPWQRGANENVNGIIRRFLPKGTNFMTTTSAQIQEIEKRINNTPRKILGYLTPIEYLRKSLRFE